MLVQNNSTAPVNLYLRDGQRYHIGVGRQITLPDSYTALLDDNASTIALFNTGVLTALTDAGAPFPNFPTAVNAADAKAGRTETLSGTYDQSGSLTLSGASAGAVADVSGEKPFSRYLGTSGNFSRAIREAVEEQCEYAATRKGRTFVVPIPEMASDWDGAPINIPMWARFKFQGGVDLNCQGATDTVLWFRSDLPGFIAPGQYLQSKNQMGEIFDTQNGVLFLRDGNMASGGCAIRIGTGDGVFGPIPTEDADIPYTILAGIGGIVWRGFDQSIQLTNWRNFCVYLHDLRGDGNRKGFVTSSAAGTDFGELFRGERVFLSNNYLSNVELNAAHQLSFLHSSFTTPQEGARHIVFNAEGGHVLFGHGRFEGGDGVSYAAADYNRALLSMTNVEIIPTPKVSGSLQPHHLRKMFTGGKHKVRGSVIDFALSGNTPYISTYAGQANYVLADDAVDIDLRGVTVKQNTNSQFKNQAPIQTKAAFIRASRGALGTRGWVGRNATVATVADAPAIGATTLGANPLQTASGTATVYMTWTNHGRQNGDQVVIAGATDVNGLLAANINGLRTLTFVNANAVSFSAASGTANANTSGGGSAVTVASPSLSLTLSNQQGQVASPLRSVQAARRYAGDILMKLMSTPTPTTPFVVNLRVMWYGGAATIPTKNNPLSTTNTSSTVTLAWPSHGRVTGETVTIAGAVDTGGIVASNLNGARAVTVVDDNTVTFVAGASATADAATGGGASITVYTDREFLSASAYAVQDLSSGRTPSNYDVWMRHGGTDIVQAPAGAEYGRLQVITNTSHTGELRIADSMAALPEC